MVERRRPKISKEFFTPPRQIEEFCVNSAEREGLLLKTVDLAFTTAFLPEEGDPFVVVDDYGNYRQFTRQIGLSDQNPKSSVTSLHICKSDLNVSDHRINPVVVEQQYKEIMIFSRDNPKIIGEIQYLYYYSRKGTPVDNLTQKVVLELKNGLTNPFIKGAFIERVVHESIGELTFGHISLQSQAIPEALGMQASDGDLLTLTFAPDRVLVTTSQQLKVVGQLSYEQLSQLGIRSRFINNKDNAILALGVGVQSFQLKLGKMPKPNYISKLFNRDIDLITDSSVIMNVHPQANLN